LKHGGLENLKGLDEVPHLAASGRTSFTADPDISKGFYRAAGFRVCGERVVRVDILERLADLIRPASAYRPGATPGEPPAGAADGEAFVVTVAMTSLTGCAGEAFASILRSLGYQSTQRPGPAITVPLLPAASTEPLSRAAAAVENGEAPASDATEEPAGEAETTDAETVVAETVVEAAEASATPVDAATQETEAPADAAVADAEEASQTVAQASAEDASVSSAEPEASAQIEVWTLQRHAHSGPRRRPQGGPAARDGAKDGRPARFDRPHGGPRRGQTEGQAEPREGGGEHRPRGDARKEAGVRPGGGKQRYDQRPQRDDGGRRRNFSSQEKREKDRLPDPDSPFAKLLALKAELEKKNKS
jgi:ATP-dependent RNA helicase SUPV3L1/SUV3